MSLIAWPQCHNSNMASRTSVHWWHLPSNDIGQRLGNDTVAVSNWKLSSTIHGQLDYIVKHNCVPSTFDGNKYNDDIYIYIYLYIAILYYPILSTILYIAILLKCECSLPILQDTEDVLPIMNNTQLVWDWSDPGDSRLLKLGKSEQHNICMPSIIIETRIYSW